ncbi:class I SAM-dependent methyltransferase [Bacillus sp. 2205SS5-2]|uniref:class I SAM-dependent methyltransferase n=1 Tax=Bacillus sp. 2205SS5-2 TaxID=3109031 RepID=UPI0030043DB4
MKLERILPFGHNLLEKAAGNGDVVIDATMGNGHDTLFLAKLVGIEGRVYSFDIQEQALLKTKALLETNALSHHVTLFRTGHENIKTMIPETVAGKVRAAIFNLGYLPGGDKNVVTGEKTTIAAIEALLDLLAPEGIIVLVIYHGHDEGKIERDALLAYTQNIDQQKAYVLQYQFTNVQNSPPFIIAIEKRK